VERSELRGGGAGADRAERRGTRIEDRTQGPGNRSPPAVAPGAGTGDGSRGGSPGAANGAGESPRGPVAIPGGTRRPARRGKSSPGGNQQAAGVRSEEHTSELQSRGHLVCRLL